MRKVLIILCTMLAFASCEMKKRKDVKSKVHKTVIFRYDKLLNDYVAYNSFSALQRLSGEYRLHTRVLTEDVLQICSFGDEQYHLKLQAVFSDSTLQSLAEDVLHRYDKMDEQERQFSRIFSRFEKLLPEVKVPLLYTQISGLNQSVVVTDSLVGISLDNYMGSNYPLYERYFSEYQRSAMRPDRMTSDVVKSYLMSVYPFSPHESPTLINRMIYLGKIFYVTSGLAEVSSVEDMLDYTVESRRWCKNNQEAAWAYMWKQGHLLSKEPQIHSKYLDTGVCTEPFGMESPHRLGLWIGIQIVDAYMRKYPETSYNDLLSNTSYLTIFSDSGFTG